MTTTQLTDYTRDTLAHVGVTLRRNNVGLKGHYSYGLKGWPDLLGYDRRGRFWAIEIKNAATKDKDRGKQERAREDMDYAGCIVAVVTRPEDVTALIGGFLSPGTYPKPHT